MIRTKIRLIYSRNEMLLINGHLDMYKYKETTELGQN